MHRGAGVRRKRIEERRVGSGLVLDDILSVIAEFRRRFRLHDEFLSGAIKRPETHAEMTLQRLVDDVIVFHDGAVFAREHSLLAGLGPLGQAIDTDVYSGFRLSPEVARDALWLVFDASLKTITQLPPRDERPNWKKIRSLGARLTKLTEALREGLDEPDLDRYFGPDVNNARLRQLPDEMTYVGRTLTDVPSRPPRMIRINSPNPQIRLATYVTGWVEAATSRKRYEVLQEIIGAAFVSTGTSAPAWTDRLGIEMHRKLRRRKQWIKHISC